MLLSEGYCGYVTYLGGSNIESVAGIAVDASVSEYVAGTTSSPDFPLTSTALGVPSAAHSCSFIAKFNPVATALMFSLCIANSRTLAFGLDASGNMYLAIDASVEFFSSYPLLKLDPAGRQVIYKTYLGAAPEAMAVDAAGNAYLTGSAGAGFGTTPGVYQPQLAPGLCATGNGQQPCTDAFVTKIGPSGALVWATYLGGSGPDDAHAIAVDSAGNPWIAGETVSPDFPVTANALQTTFHGEVDFGPMRFGDGFVAKLDPAAGRLLYSTYLGGSAPDAVFALAIDSAGSAYATGGTQSFDFPTTPGTLPASYVPASRQTPSLNGNAFVTKFQNSGAVVFSTYLGGPRGTAIAVDTAGETAVNAVPPATPSNCSRPAAVSVLNAAGSSITASSPVGGQYLTWDANGGLYSAGQTETLVFLTTPHTYQTQYGGGASDAYAGKVDFTQQPGPAVSSLVNAASLLAGGVQPFLTGEVAPGEIVTLFGNGFGSRPAVNFDSFAAPVIYASNCQINAVVPFELSSQAATFVTVQTDGAALGPVKLPVVSAAPGVFTLNGTGAGQAAVLNQDGSVNSVSNPAARGSYIAVYMTGAGALYPAVADGSAGPAFPPFPAPFNSMRSSIGNVVFAGQAPDLIAGATQLNIRIDPSTATGGAVPLIIYAGGYNSPAVTIAVK